MTMNQHGTPTSETTRVPRRRLRCTQSAHAFARRITRNWGSHRDEGNMFLALLFTIIMVGLTAVVSAAALAGEHKTRNSRDFAIALEAADQAFSNALMTANTANLPVGSNRMSVLTDANHFGTTAVHEGTAGVGNQVKWSWTATQKTSGQPIWTIKVAVTGIGTIDRHFTATLKGSQVLQKAATSANTEKVGAFHITGTGVDYVHYLTTASQGYQYGFLGDGSALRATSAGVFQDDLNNTGVTFTDNSGAGWPDVDGYNGESGTVGSNAKLSLGNSNIDKIEQWNWKSANLCTGAACTTAATQTIPDKAAFSDSDLNSHCASGIKPAWTPASGALIGGSCYTSLNFNTSYTTPITGSGVIYVKGDVTVATGVVVNGANSTRRDYLNIPANRLRIALGGNYTQASGSQVAAGILATNRLTTGQGKCTITANAGTITALMGAATCEQLNVNGPARLRVDGGLKNDNVAYDTTQPTLPLVWLLSDYTSKD